MSTPKRRRHCLYLNPIAEGALTIFRAPDRFIRWYDLRAAILKTLRDRHAVKAANVFAIEGIGGYLPEDGPRYAEEDAATLPKFEAAFAGDPERFAGFHLYAWDEETQGFELARKATK